MTGVWVSRKYTALTALSMWYHGQANLGDIHSSLGSFSQGDSSSPHVMGECPGNQSNTSMGRILTIPGHPQRLECITQPLCVYFVLFKMGFPRKSDEICIPCCTGVCKFPQIGKDNYHRYHFTERWGLRMQCFLEGRFHDVMESYPLS